jgi:arylsulfatase A-like enzyme
MGYRTPNIDRVAKEGALFTDWYGQQSCTAGRARQKPARFSVGEVLEKLERNAAAMEAAASGSAKRAA